MVSAPSASQKATNLGSSCREVLDLESDGASEGQVVVEHAGEGGSRPRSGPGFGDGVEAPRSTRAYAAVVWR